MYQKVSEKNIFAKLSFGNQASSFRFNVTAHKFYIQRIKTMLEQQVRTTTNKYTKHNQETMDI